MTLPEMNQMFDYLLAHPRHDEGGRYALITSLLGSMLILPSGGDMVSGEGSFQPVLNQENGARHVVAFGSKEAAMAVQDMAPFAMTLKGSDLVCRVTPGLGMIVIADSGRLVLEPDFVDRIRSDVAAGRA